MKKLQALKINNTTYPIYEMSGAPVHPLSVVNDLFLVKNPDFPGGWEFYEEADFRKNYKWVKPNPQSQTDFSPVVRVTNNDDE